MISTAIQQNYYLTIIGQQVDEPCGVGVEQNKGKCRMDLECVFDDLALFGTCQVKGNNKIKSIF